VESVSGHAGGGGGLTIPPTQRNRAHNLGIVSTISNDTESLDWEPLESKLLAAVAYVAPRRTLYLRFHSGEVYRYSPSPLINITTSSRLNPKAAISSVTSEIASLTKHSLAIKQLSQSDQDGGNRTITSPGRTGVFARF
jgi:hypothetical protein